MDSIKYVTQDEYDATVREMRERCRKKAAQDALREQWRNNGCNLPLAAKLIALDKA